MATSGGAAFSPPQREAVVLNMVTAVGVGGGWEAAVETLLAERPWRTPPTHAYMQRHPDAVISEALRLISISGSFRKKKIPPDFIINQQGTDSFAYLQKDSTAFIELPKMWFIQRAEVKANQTSWQSKITSRWWVTATLANDGDVTSWGDSKCQQTWQQRPRAL